MPNRDTLGSREPNRKKEERRKKKEERRKKKALCRRLQRKMAREFITRIGRRSARGFQSRLATQRGRLGGPNALSCRPRLPLRRPRPSWPWPLQPTLERQRNEHLRRRPCSPHRSGRLERRDSRRPFYGVR